MFPPLTPAVRSLLIANAAIFLLQYLLGGAFTKLLALYPLGHGFMPWQVLTAGFAHATFGHLFFNMFALWMFGSSLEMVWGQRRFLTYYFVCLLGANVLQLLVSTWLLSQGELSTALGASGAVFGLLLAYGMIFPNNRMIVFPIPVEIRARNLVIVYGALELLLAYTGWQPGVAHFVHLGGMLFGWLLIRYWRGQPPFGKRRPPGPRIVR